MATAVKNPTMVETAPLLDGTRRASSNGDNKGGKHKTWAGTSTDRVGVVLALSALCALLFLVSDS